MQVSGIGSVGCEEKEKDEESENCGEREVRVDQDRKPLNGNGRLCGREGAIVRASENNNLTRISDRCFLGRFFMLGSR